MFNKKWILFRCYGIAILSGNARRLFSHDLPLPPLFVRFGNVKVATYAVWNGSNSIGKIISSFGKYSNAFKASKLTLKATIDESDWSCFPNQTTMLDYLSNELLPIFDSSYCTFDFLYIRLSHTFHSGQRIVQSLLPRSCNYHRLRECQQFWWNECQQFRWN